MFEAYRSGNNSLSTVLKAIVYVLYYYGTLARSPRLGVASRWFYDRFQSIWGGSPFPRKAGKIKAGQAHPRLDLDLKQGELVRMKSYEQILETLDSSALNRGLGFDASSFRIAARCSGYARALSASSTKRPARC